MDILLLICRSLAEGTHGLCIRAATAQTVAFTLALKKLRTTIACIIIQWLQGHKTYQSGDKHLVQHFVNHQVRVYEDCLGQHLQANMVQRLKSMFKDLIFHCEDHVNQTDAVLPYDLCQDDAEDLSSIIINIQTM